MVRSISYAFDIGNCKFDDKVSVWGNSKEKNLIPEKQPKLS